MVPPRVADRDETLAELTRAFERGAVAFELPGFRGYFAEMEGA